MLSSILGPINNVPVGQHPNIIRLWKGIINSITPVVKLLPELELPKVLDVAKTSIWTIKESKFEAFDI